MPVGFHGASHLSGLECPMMQRMASLIAAAAIASAALGWRAALNRRFASHGQWMIRSYVLVWSFVFCRIASRVIDLDGNAFIWLSWVGPILVCEMVLQWDEGARKAPRGQLASPGLHQSSAGEPG